MYGLMVCRLDKTSMVTLTLVTGPEGLADTWLEFALAPAELAAETT